MKKIIVIVAAFGMLIATSCSNEIRKETLEDSLTRDSLTRDSLARDSANKPDTTTMPPDTTMQN
jgi:hypothetical protein